MCQVVNKLVRYLCCESLYTSIRKKKREMAVSWLIVSGSRHSAYFNNNKQFYPHNVLLQYVISFIFTLWFHTNTNFKSVDKIKTVRTFSYDKNAKNNFPVNNYGFCISVWLCYDSLQVQGCETVTKTRQSFGIFALFWSTLCWSLITSYIDYNR